jgi:hypothetical protein
LQLKDRSIVTFYAVFEFHVIGRKEIELRLKYRISAVCANVSCEIFRWAQRLKPFGSLIIATAAQFFSSQSCCIIANSFQPPKKEIVSL